MLRTWLSAIVAALLAVAACAGEAPDEAKLIAIIQSDAPPQDKAIPCKQLAVYGTKAAVPALAALLPNPELSSWARIALEAIPDPAADEALRAAVGKLDGRLLIGVINSIGVRRDAQAIDLLIAKLKAADPEVAAAAAEALGRIGGDAAAKALEPLLASAPPVARSAAAYGLVLCAEQLLDAGKADDAARLYDAIRKADVPRQRALEGLRGAILARKAAGVPLLAEQLKSADKASFHLALRVARELPGPEATEAIAAELNNAPAERQPLLILALADRRDPKAVAAVLAAAKSGSPSARLAAVAAIERLGDASCVPVLLDAAASDDEALARTAKVSLARLPGAGVDADLAARLPKATGKAQQVLLELIGLRRIEAGLPDLVKYAAAPDAATRAAAVASLTLLGGEKQVPDLVTLIQKAQDGNEQAAIEKALVAVCGRAGAACAPQLMPLAKNDAAPLRTVGLRALAVAGGPEALAAVKAALDDKEAAVQDEAVRTLSNWPSKWPEDLAVMEPLLALAKSSKKAAHQILGLRGYLQAVQGAAKLAAADRLARVNEVLPLIAKDEEKRLAIAALGTIGVAGALDALSAFAADAGVAEEACAALIDLAARSDLQGVTKEQRQKALQTAAEKTKAARTRRRAEDAMKALK